MKSRDAEIGTEVVRSKGDYVVGRTGTITEIDFEKNRARVKWNFEPRTWVNFNSLEPTSIPYEITPSSFDEKKYRPIHPKYKRKIS